MKYRMGVFVCQGNVNETLISKVKRIEIRKSNYPRLKERDLTLADGELS